MPLPVYHLRRWLAVIAVLFVATIAGMYFYARQRERRVLKEVPNKLGIEIKQTASGFEFSKSDGRRTLFRVHAASVKQFKLDGSAELHDVSVILYGRDSSRFDQIYGDDFYFDKRSGDISGRGEVQIDLQANPGGLNAPDQGAPKELKNPIHLKTRDLVFNQNTGDASTNSRVDFRTPQASGWAVGAQYIAKENSLRLISQVHVNLAGPEASTLTAASGTINRDPRVVVLAHPFLQRPAGSVQAEQATFFLGADNNVERVLAEGGVTAETSAAESDHIRARADRGEILLTGTQNLIRTATLSGRVHVERSGLQPMQADAGRALLDFRGQNELQKIHAMDNVRLAQQGVDKALPTSRPDNASRDEAQSQDLEITAPVIDFFLADGRRLDYAETSDAAQITISPAQAGKPEIAAQHTIVTAGRFEANFVPAPDGSSQLTSVHGAPDARIVNINPGLPDRVSTGATLDVTFSPAGGISSIVQQGNVAYTDNQPPEKRTQAWADKGVYTPSDRVLVLTGHPRVSDGSMETTASTIRINRNSGDAFADGDVKSTYSEAKEQPGGALLASSSPIHVTAAAMAARNFPAIATYTGNARLWQDANIVEAPSIQFDRDRRFLTAKGTAAQPVSTVFVQGKKPSTDGSAAGPPLAGTSSLTSLTSVRKSGARAAENPAEAPFTITSTSLTYADSERKAHYEGGVTARGENFSATAKEMNVYLLPRTEDPSPQQLATPGRLDRMIAEDDVVIVQPDRQARGQKLVYTASDDKFVLTGGPPSIFDAEHGKITGDSLTFFRSNDRVLVEGEASTPVVTQTRMAH